MDLTEVVGQYILAKIDVTECMQKNFRQVCGKCSRFLLCKTYNKYVNFWIKLQEAFFEETER